MPALAELLLCRDFGLLHHGPHPSVFGHHHDFVDFEVTHVGFFLARRFFGFVANGVHALQQIAKSENLKLSEKLDMLACNNRR